MWDSHVHAANTSSAHCPGGRRFRCALRGPRAFSLVELIIVLAVAVLLTGLLLPVLSQVRKNVDRVICASQLRQMGLGIAMYDRDNKDTLPYSALLEARDFAEMTAAHVYRLDPPDGGQRLDDMMVTWDGIGLLHSGDYCGPQCFYCPSHRGAYTLERYQEQYAFGPVTERIYTNYHYGGHRDWEFPNDERVFQRGGEGIVLLTDSLQHQSDINHDQGFNVLRDDISVLWREDGGAYTALLPGDGGPPEFDYTTLWHKIEGSH